jgi:hypothetical protein
VKIRTTTLNQRGEAVQVSVGNLMVPRREAGEMTISDDADRAGR